MSSGGKIEYNNDNTILKSVTGVSTLVIKSTAINIHGLDQNTYCFKGSKDVLTSFSFEDDPQLTKISKYAFFECRQLQEADFSKCTKLSEIGDYAFHTCEKMQHIYFPNSTAITISQYAFGYSGLTSIFFPASVQKFSYGTFHFCESLVSAEFDPYTQITSLASHVFFYCRALKNFTIPKSLESFAAVTFMGSDNINDIFLAEGNTHIVVENGVVYSKEGNTLIYYPPGRTGTYTIKDTVVIINRNAFFGAHISKVIISENVRGIFDYAFSTSKISSIEFSTSKNLTTISDSAFRSCPNLASIVLPEGLKTIGPWAFDSCSNLQSITLPSTVESIGGSAFKNCKEGVVIKFPDDSDFLIDTQFLITNRQVTEIIQYVGKEKSIKIASTIIKIKTGAFSGCSWITSIEFEGTSSLTTIERIAFKDCTDLKTFNFPDSLQTIGEQAFMSSGITSISIGTKVTSIGASCFKKCLYLTSANIGSDAITIDEQAFSQCSRLENIVFTNPLSAITYECFKGCGKLTSFTFTASMNSFADNAFESSGLLKADLTLVTATSLPSKMFHSCIHLSEVKFPETGLKSIGQYCFYNTNITSVTLTPCIETLGLNAFQNCKELETLTIPENTNLVLSGNVFQGCSKFSSIINNDERKFSLNNGILYNKAQTELYIMPMNCPNNYISLPETLTKITSSAFCKCMNLFIVFIPDNSVTTIGEYAFENCNNLKAINLPKTVTTVGKDAFSGCNKLQCGLFIDNKEPEFQKQLEAAKLPKECINECVKAFTCKPNRYSRFSFGIEFFTLSLLLNC